MNIFFSSIFHILSSPKTWFIILQHEFHHGKCWFFLYILNKNAVDIDSTRRLYHYIVPLKKGQSTHYII